MKYMKVIKSKNPMFTGTDWVIKGQDAVCLTEGKGYMKVKVDYLQSTSFSMGGLRQMRKDYPDMTPRELEKLFS